MLGVIGTLGMSQRGKLVKDEQPDWNFWCFVIALIELAAQAMT